MCSRALLLLGFVARAQWSAASAADANGCTFTNLPSVHMSATDGSLNNGACGFGPLATTVSNPTYTAAFGTTLYRDGLACGECYLLTNPATAAAKGGLKSITVTITDLCPQLKSDGTPNNVCADGNAIDLSYAAWEALGIVEDSTGGRVDGRKVPCDLGGVEISPAPTDSVVLRTGQTPIGIYMEFKGSDSMQIVPTHHTVQLAGGIVEAYWCKPINSWQDDPYGDAEMYYPHGQLPRCYEEGFDTDSLYQPLNRGALAHRYDNYGLQPLSNNLWVFLRFKGENDGETLKACFSFGDAREGELVHLIFEAQPDVKSGIVTNLGELSRNFVHPSTGDAHCPKYVPASAAIVPRASATLWMSLLSVIVTLAAAAN
jgi:hypothetical protein